MASAVSAAAATTIVTALALIAFAAYQRRRAARATEEAVRARAPEPPPSDGSLLRIGSIGGRSREISRSGNGYRYRRGARLSSRRDRP